MAKLKDLALRGAGDRLLFDLEAIKEKPGYNARSMESEETQAHIRRMADAVKMNGTEAFPPITIFQEEGSVYVRAGHCRLRAHKLAKAEGAPVIGIQAIAAPAKADEAEQVLDLLNSNDGLPLTPLEKAQVVKRLLSFGWLPAEIAKRRGCSVTAIDNLVKLLDAPKEVVEMVRNNEVSARTAVDVIRQTAATVAPGEDSSTVATEVLRTAVETAKAEGKTKATAKHIPKPSEFTDWKKYGPKLKTALEAIRDADSQEELQQCIAAASNLLAELR